MKKLSLKESKKRCAELWDWLANNPRKKKRNWPSWIDNGGSFCAIHRCFACEYSKTSPNSFQKCNRCFLLNLWFDNKISKDINRKIKEGFLLPCEDSLSSPFKLWKEYQAKKNLKKASFYARKIADYCKKSK